MTLTEVLGTLGFLYGDEDWPKPLHRLLALRLAKQGVPIPEAARRAGTSLSSLDKLVEARDPVKEALGIGLREITDEHRRRARTMLGQLLLGRCAEIAFERIYRAEMHTEEFELRDLREGRSDTDYRLLNGQGRPVYRINIKFHGSQFRRAPELVGLEPLDCFALATYKIWSALQKQEEDQLPYIFAVVGVPELSADRVGEEIPSLLVGLVALVHQAPRGQRKRDLEDRVIRRLVESEHEVFLRTLDRIASADWYMLSARKADALLRELLFARVFALRIRNFAQAFRGAELDMHFSLSQDLTPLRDYLKTLRDGGIHQLTTLLERGRY